MRKLVFIVLILVAGLLLFGCTQDKSQLNHFKDANFGFEFDYPVAWGIPAITSDRNTFEAYFYPEGNVYVRIKLAKYYGDYNSDSIEIFRQNLLSGFYQNKFKLIKEDWVILSDFNAYRVETEAGSTTGDTNVRNIDVFQIRNNFLYGISFSATNNKYNDYVQNFDEMVNSVRWTESKGN